MQLARRMTRLVASLSVFVGRRFVANRLPEVASALTFTSLLALVPLMTISFAIFAAFPAFNEAEAELEAFIFGNFVPHASDAVQGYLSRFRGNVGQLSAFGIVGLGVTSVLLLVTIESALNRLFMVRRQRAMIRRLLAYWALLTLGPVFFLVSVTFSSMVYTFANQAGGQEVGNAVSFIGSVVPYVLAFIGYVVMYTVMPNRHVEVRDAAIGAGVAALLFEGLKAAFGLYVTTFPFYQTVYGAISVLPILLIWIYLSWIVTLVGAGITAALPEWRATSGVEMTAAPRSIRLALAIEALRLLRRAQRHGETVAPHHLVRRLRIAPTALEQLLERLEKSGYVRETRRYRWVLSREISDLSLYDLMLALDIQTRQPEIGGGPVAGLEDPIGEAIQSERSIYSVPLSQVLDGDAPTPILPRQQAPAAEEQDLSRRSA